MDWGGLPTATPDSRFAVVSQLSNSGYANYHSLVASWRRSFAHGFQGQISYTWSHALDTVSNGGVLSFSYDSIVNLHSLNYSNADYDVRHNLTGGFIWEMPKLRNRWLNSAVGGWSAGGRLSDYTGTPFSVTNSGIQGLSTTVGETVLADVLDSHVRTECGRSAVTTPCFAASQFAPSTTQANLGNLPRNSFRGPGLFNLDGSVFKTAVRRERLRMDFGVNAYNLLNHPNFSDPVSDLASSGIGLIQATAINTSGPYGFRGGPSGRALVVMGKLVF